jgi:imidazolonepropionase-like amidohydrolase
MLEQGIIAVPTLTMMELVAQVIKQPGTSFNNAPKSVYNMYKAGIPILAGTDCNAASGSPAQIKHGESRHHELELLVEAGMSTVDVLRAAGVASAGVFGLEDRGVIQVGKRADLVLVDGSPIEDITATRKVKGVWCKGVHVEAL